MRFFSVWFYKDVLKEWINQEYHHQTLVSVKTLHLPEARAPLIPTPSANSFLGPWFSRNHSKAMDLIKTPSASLRHSLVCFPLCAGLISELPVSLEPPESASSPHPRPCLLVSGPSEHLRHGLHPWGSVLMECFFPPLLHCFHSFLTTGYYGRNREPVSCYLILALFHHTVINSFQPACLGGILHCHPQDLGQVTWFICVSAFSCENNITLTRLRLS